MQLPDVNVLVYAYQTGSRDHAQYRSWLDNVVNGDEAYGMADIVCSGFLRIVTHRAVFDRPAPIDEALPFIEGIRSGPACVIIAPGARHWAIFTELCRTSAARGNLVPDAYLAALAIESGSEWITTDRDFARFQGLRWRHPFN
jgi:hypothetical protein